MNSESLELRQRKQPAKQQPWVKLYEAITMCGMECVVQILCLSLVVVSFPVYTLFIYMLVKNRNHRMFKSPFYRISIVLGVVDLVTISHYYLFFRSTRWQLLKTMHLAGGALLCRYWGYVMIGSQRAQELLLLATAFNRYSAVIQPMKHKAIWTPKYTLKAIGLCLALAYSSSVNIVAVCEVEPIVNGSSDVVGCRLPGACWMSTFLGSALLTFVCSVLFIVLYGRMVWVSRCRAKESTEEADGVKTDASAFQERASQNFILIGCVLSSQVVFNAALHFVVVMFPRFYKTGVMVSLTELHWAVFCMCNPYLVLLCAKAAQEEFLTMVGFSKVGTAPNSVKTTKWNKK